MESLVQRPWVQHAPVEARKPMWAAVGSRKMLSVRGDTSWAIGSLDRLTAGAEGQGPTVDWCVLWEEAGIVLTNNNGNCECYYVEVQLRKKVVGSYARRPVSKN